MFPSIPVIKKTHYAGAARRRIVLTLAAADIKSVVKSPRPPPRPPPPPHALFTDTGIDTDAEAESSEGLGADTTASGTLVMHAQHYQYARVPDSKICFSNLFL